MTDAQKAPKGIVMMLIAPDAQVVTSVSDFDQSGYGGFTIQRAQEIRCKRALAYAALRAFANPIVATVTDGYRAEEMINEMERKHGYRIHTVAIGYAND